MIQSTAPVISTLRFTELAGSPDAWQLLRRRQARETLRSVYRANDRFIVKQFETHASLPRYRRPWLIEDSALRRLNGRGAPRTFGWHEQTTPELHTVWLIKEFIDGEPVARFTPEDLPELAQLLAHIHGAGVMTDDNNISNFLRAADGRLIFLDFGSARLTRRERLCSARLIGRDLAKLRREGFNWNAKLFTAFLPLYFDALGASRPRRAAIRAATACVTALRMIRKFLTRGNPRA
ncbi:MAG: hypothetical protein GX803_06025 [Lentisphaerae bacterium]|jgi:hypothetical protein|nr:hypothetical protein [Lentisphaerota bacterium]